MDNHWQDYSSKEPKTWPPKNRLYLVRLHGTQWGNPPVRLAVFNEDHWESQNSMEGVTTINPYVIQWHEIPNF